MPKNGGDDLRIPAPAQGQPSRDPWSGVPQGGPPPGAVLQPPQSGLPAAGASTYPNTPPQPASPYASNVTPTTPALATATPVQAQGAEDRFKQAQRQLATHGVLGQRLEMTTDTGEWRFTCYVPNRQNPKVHRAYGARAKDPLAAIQAVLDKINQEQP